MFKDVTQHSRHLPPLLAAQIPAKPCASRATPLRFRNMCALQ
jgi:hypothetical protein